METRVLVGTYSEGGEREYFSWPGFGGAGCVGEVYYIVIEGDPHDGLGGGQSRAVAKLSEVSIWAVCRASTSNTRATRSNSLCYFSAL